jgi:hypothetical protein
VVSQDRNDILKIFAGSASLHNMACRDLAFQNATHVIPKDGNRGEYPRDDVATCSDRL